MDITCLIDQMIEAIEKSELDKAIHICRVGIDATENTTFDSWYAFRINLAYCLMEVGTDWAIDEAISICRLILTRIMKDNILNKLRTIHMYLGYLYNERQNGIIKDNLVEAINYYEMTLKSINPKIDSLLWASVIVQLSKSYLKLSKLLGSLPDGARSIIFQLRNAIHAFDQQDCIEERKIASNTLKRLKEVASTQ